MSDKSATVTRLVVVAGWARRKSTWIVAGALLLVSLVAHSAWSARVGDAGGLEEALAEAKAAGVPTSAVDLQATNPIEREDNAFPYLRRLKNHLSAWHEFGASSDAKKIQSAICLGDAKSAATGLSKYRAACELATLAANRKGFQVDWDYDLGPLLFQSEAHRVSQAAQLLCLRAELRDLEGDFRGALADYGAVMSLSNLPLEPGGYFGISARSRALRDLGQSVNRCLSRPKTTDQLKGLLAILRRPRRRLDMQQVVCVQFYKELVTLRNWAVLEPVFSDSSKQHEQDWEERAAAKFTRQWPKSPPLRTKIAATLPVFERALAATRKAGSDYRLLIRDLSLVDQELEMLNRKHPVAFTQIGLGPMLQFAISQETQALVTTGLVQCVIFKSENGRWPATLQEAGCHDLDPFTGKPLRLKLSSGRLRVYSLGADELDDGGFVRSETKNYKRFDLVAAYPPFPSR